MPALDNPKHEAFCQEVVLNGGDRSAAFRKTYPHSLKWKDKSVNENASKLYAKVKPRVAELQAKAAEVAEKQFEVNAEYVLRRLVEIDQMDVLDILNDDGSFKHISAWPKVWRQYLSSMDMSELFEGYGEDREMVGLLKKIKWPDKVKNLELLGKHVSVNAFREQIGVSSPTGGPVTWELLPVAANAGQSPDR